MTKGYDIIGDIHGYADKLESLLTRMDYKINANGYFEHPERTAVFLGDFIDRGKQQARTLDIVKPMIKNGSAKAVIGNHEFNAVCFATKSSEGGYLRPHMEENKHQHGQFLKEFPFGSKEYLKQIEWFKTLPVYLDLEDIFVVHACPCTENINNIQKHLDSQNRVTDAGYQSFIEGSNFFKALEVILKGPEHGLPAGINYKDINGIKRDRSRVAWWKNNNDTVFNRLLELDISNEKKELLNNSVMKVQFNPIKKPTFVGHYWRTGKKDLLSEQVACVDYSAGKNEDLVAYRWNGETKLNKKNFTW